MVLRAGEVESRFIVVEADDDAGRWVVMGLLDQGAKAGVYRRMCVAVSRRMAETIVQALREANPPVDWGADG